MGSNYLCLCGRVIKERARFNIGYPNLKSKLLGEMFLHQLLESFADVDDDVTDLFNQ